MKEEKIYFPSTQIRLEALLQVDHAHPAKGGVILCHPHPLYGGDMHHPVLDAGVQAAREEGMWSLRFNFRGVGGSEGHYAEGRGEQEDVRAAIDTLGAAFEGGGHFLVLLGYSFGAWTGLPVAVQDERVMGLAAVAPPLEIYDFDFLRGSRKKKLILVGDRDLYCPLQRLHPWFSSLDEPKSLTLLEGSDHFFFSSYHSLVAPLKEYFRSFSASSASCKSI